MTVDTATEHAWRYLISQSGPVTVAAEYTLNPAPTALMTAGSQLEQLVQRFPHWDIRSVRVHGGMRVEAVRTGAGSGTYAVIGTALEVERELCGPPTG
jgi:hypothetical protein